MMYRLQKCSVVCKLEKAILPKEKPSPRQGGVRISQRRLNMQVEKMRNGTVHNVFGSRIGFLAGEKVSSSSES